LSEWTAEWISIDYDFPPDDVEVLTCRTVDGKGKQVSTYDIASVSENSEIFFDYEGREVEVDFWCILFPPKGVEG
jgi:hypothetical protein